MRIKVSLAVVVIVVVSSVVSQSHAQEKYQEPPADVVDLIDAEAEPSIRFSPDCQWMLVVERDAMPSIADVSRRNHGAIHEQRERVE